MTGMSWLSAAKLAMCFVVVALTAGLVPTALSRSKSIAHLAFRHYLWTIRPRWRR